MIEEKARILTGSYSSVDDGVIIELFCKNEEGESITLLYEGFRPYFYLVDPPKESIQYLENEGEIRKLEKTELWVDGGFEPCLKVILTYPWKVPKYRNKLKKKCKILAADIPFIQRFIFDLNLGSTVIAKGDEVDLDQYSTDRVVRVEEFKESEPLKPEMAYLSFDIENSIEREEIYTISCFFKDGEEEKERCFHGDEEGIIEDFQDFVVEQDPDIITGYNINGYDLPVLKRRSDSLGLGGINIGREGSDIKEVSRRRWRVNGRILADAWWAVRNELNLKRETLNHVSKELLGEEKEDVDPLEVDREWEEDPEKVMDYCLKDSKLAYRVLENIGSIDKAMDMATVSKLPIEEGLNGRTSTLVDSILIREADRNDIGVPLTRHGGKGGKIKGGYVHSIEPGLYHWVSVLDFKSMYPSIIIENNICFTTLSSEGSIESPTGAKFLSVEEKEGILPRILRDLMDEREEVKKKMEKAEGRKKEYYEGLQGAIKVLMNSFYGVFASSFYRFTDPTIGESITAFARENIRELIDKLEGEDIKVIYSDTDSVFFQSPKEDLDATIQLSERIADEYTKGDMVLEFEKVLNPFFSHGRKKRYVGKVIWPEEEMLVRGYELRRSDSFEAQNEALEDVFEHILDDDIDGAIDTAKDWIKKAKEGCLPHEKLVISRSCKDFSSYVNPDSMPNVQAARKMKELGYQFIPGMKVSWIVIDAQQTPQDVEPWLHDRTLEREPDWHYYARRIAKTLSRVTEVFGWDEKGLMAGNKQSKLFSDRFGEEKDDNSAEGGEEPKKTDEELTLEDFM